MAAQPSSSSSTGDTKFDASQYAFFGNNVGEEVELGGLEDDDGVDAAFVGPGDEEYPSAYGRDIFESHFRLPLLGIDGCSIQQRGAANQQKDKFWDGLGK
ncbi:hypothetical protein E2562_010378 [Oryza meyeriana var. granulata]|uniref:Uncharacterized protein n=1 Tax=Oryza meyeriana var. granulata TaxID=110450 RepID=A0A6G1F6I2_9ORYZ|nr:hypothetical protein E2562_010378 [Oryza meyeriana var. granulata]